MNGIVHVRDGHVFETDEHGDQEYHEMGDHHGGPHCLICDKYWCLHCNPEIFTEKCPERHSTLDGLEYPQPPRVRGRRIEL